MGVDFDSLKNIANDDVAGRTKDFLAGESCGEQPDPHAADDPPASNEGGGVTHTVPVKNFSFDDRALDD